MAAHSMAQAAMFFALGAELGHSEIEMKERAKKRYALDCFNKLTSAQINELIDLLQKQKELRGKEENNVHPV